MRPVGGDFKESCVMHRNSGEVTGEALVFGGPYSNLQAIEALIAEAAQRRVPAGSCICTGDVVAYCGNRWKRSPRSGPSATRLSRAIVNGNWWRGCGVRV